MAEQDITSKLEAMNRISELVRQRDDLLVALRQNYEFTKYAAAIKKTNTDEYMEEFFIQCESAQEIAKTALAQAQSNTSVTPKKSGVLR